MPVIKELKAQGLTIPELRDLIAERLRGPAGNPTVNVQLLRNNSKKYTLIGAVRRPGAYPLLQETTILDALAASGGFDVLAAPEKIKLLRGQKFGGSNDRPDGLNTTPPGAVTAHFSLTFPFNYNEVLNGIHPEQNVTIQDGDIIVVPE